MYCVRNHLPLPIFPLYYIEGFDVYLMVLLSPCLGYFYSEQPVHHQAIAVMLNE